MEKSDPNYTIKSKSSAFTIAAEALVIVNMRADVGDKRSHPQQY